MTKRRGRRKGEGVKPKCVYQRMRQYDSRLFRRLAKENEMSVPDYIHKYILTAFPYRRLMDKTLLPMEENDAKVE